MKRNRGYFTMRVSARVRRELKNLAERDECSQSDVVRRLILREAGELDRPKAEQVKERREELTYA